MRVNLILDMANNLKGSGIYSSAIRTFQALQQEGIDIELNGRRKITDYDIIHFQTALPGSFLKAKKLANLKNRRPKIVMHAHTTVEDFQGSFIIASKRITHPYLTRFYNFADSLVAVSEYNKSLLIKYGFHPEKISVISNGIDLSKIQKNEAEGAKFRRNLGLSDTTLLVFAVGGVLYRKGPDLFVRTAKLLQGKDFYFIWAGRLFPMASLAYRKSMVWSFNQALQMPHVRFTGYLPSIKGLYNAGDVFFLPTREENQGIVVLEAINYDKSLLLSEIPVFDWLKHGYASMKGVTPADFAECLQVLHDNPNLRKNLTEQAKALLPQHSLAVSAKLIVKLYTRLLES
ncbi:MAG: glycosyltransferase family 4 protein [Candidatus Hodarchaeota archaeon]